MGAEAYRNYDKDGVKISDYAAKKCLNHEAGGNDDWFLPSRDELDLMHKNLKLQGLGGFLVTTVGVPRRAVQAPRGSSTSTMGISTTTIGSSTTGSGLYGLSDEPFTNLSIYPLKGGAGGLGPPLNCHGIVR